MEREQFSEALRIVGYIVALIGAVVLFLAWYWLLWAASL
jgi:hypothetical protein